MKRLQLYVYMFWILTDNNLRSNVLTLDLHYDRDKLGSRVFWSVCSRKARHSSLYLHNNDQCNRINITDRFVGHHIIDRTNAYLMNKVINIIL